MEVSGQLQISPLYLGENHPPRGVHWIGCWVGSGVVWTVWTREKYCPCRDRTPAVQQDYGCCWRTYRGFIAFGGKASLAKYVYLLIVTL
jgi:hypothetical protein